MIISDALPIFSLIKRNKITYLVPKFSIEEKGDNIINFLIDIYSDASHFLRYFFGETKYGYIIVLIKKMIKEKVDLNFLFNNELSNKNIESLREYIELKNLFL